MVVWVVVYRDHCWEKPVERPVLRDHCLETTCLERPPVLKDHIHGRSSNIIMQWNLCPKTTCLERLFSWPMGQSFKAGCTVASVHGNRHFVNLFKRITFTVTKPVIRALIVTIFMAEEAHLFLKIGYKSTRFTLPHLWYYSNFTHKGMINF